MKMPAHLTADEQRLIRALIQKSHDAATTIRELRAENARLTQDVATLIEASQQLTALSAEVREENEVLHAALSLAHLLPAAPAATSARARL